MLRTGQNFKVFYSVVEFIIILMMNYLRTCKKTTQVFFYDHSMLKFSTYTPIPRKLNTATPIHTVLFPTLKKTHPLILTYTRAIFLFHPLIFTEFVSTKNNIFADDTNFCFHSSSITKCNGNSKYNLIRFASLCYN